MLDTVTGVLTVTGTSAADTIQLNDSGDVLNVAEGSSSQNFSLSAINSIQIFAGEGDDSVMLDNTLYKNAKIHGEAGNDTLIGGAGNDTLRGGDGNDSLIGQDGKDRLQGERDNDTLQGGNGNDTLEAGKGDDMLRGEAGDDVLYGGIGSDSLEGGIGYDTLGGGRNNDTLLGGDGDDKLTGGKESDLLQGGAGIDTADYSGKIGSLLINLDDIANDGDVDPTTGLSTEFDNATPDIENVISGAGNDQITGSNANNTLTGGAGNDTLIGGAGDDILYAQDGLLDTLDGGEGSDRAGRDETLDTITGIEGFVGPLDIPDLRAAAESSSPSSDIHLTWRNLDGEQGYIIEQASSSLGSPWFQIGATGIDRTHFVTFYPSGGFPPIFRVRASNPGSPWSNTAEVEVSANQILTSISLSPAGPTLDNGQTQQFAATARDQFGNAMASQPTFAWSVDADADAADGTITNGGLYTAPAAGTGSDTIRAVGGGLAGTATVAINDGGNPSNGVTFTVRSTAQVDLDWANSTDPDLVGYNLFRGTDPNFTQAFENQIAMEIETSDFIDVDLESASTYYYKVTAVLSDNTEIVIANAAQVETLAADSAPPSAPTNLVAAAANDSEIILSWTDNSANETEFVVQQSLNGIGGWTTIGSVEANAENFTARNLDDETPYYFQLQAENTAGASPTTAPAAATTNPVNTDYYVILVGGHFQTQAYLDAGNSVGAIANLLRENNQLNLNVHVYAEFVTRRQDRSGIEPGILTQGRGQAYTDFQRAFDRGMRRWAIIGYSHGGGITYQFTNRIDDEAPQVNPARLGFSGYIDAIQRTNDDDFGLALIIAETRRPPGSLYHLNIYQQRTLVPRGDTTIGANENMRIFQTDAGGHISHQNIVAQPSIQEYFQDELIEQLQQMV